MYESNFDDDEDYNEEQSYESSKEEDTEQYQFISALTQMSKL